MRTPRLASLAPVVLGASMLVPLLASPCAIAQEDDSPTVASSQFSIDLVFDGGTLGELVDQLEQSSPSVNIIMDERSRTFGVPALAVRKTSVTLLLEALEELALPPTPQDMLIIRSHRSDLVVQQGAGARRGPVTKIPEPVHTIIARRRDGTRDASESGEPIRTHVISLARIVEMTGSSDASLGAVEMVLSTAGDDATAIRFHEPTRTLVVRGPISTIGAVTEVIESLEEGARWSERAREEQAKLERLNAELEERRAEVLGLQALRDERDVLQVELRAMQAQLESGFAEARSRIAELEDVRNRQQRRVEELEVELVRTTSMLRDLEAERERLKAELDRVRGPRSGGGSGGERRQ